MADTHITLTICAAAAGGYRCIAEVGALTRPMGLKRPSRRKRFSMRSNSNPGHHHQPAKRSARCDRIQDCRGRDGAYFPINTRTDRIGSLVIGQIFDELEDSNQSQAPRTLGWLTSLLETGE